MGDLEFTGSRNILEGKARLLRQNGLGKRPNTSNPLSSDNEEILLQENKLGKQTPASLDNTMWINNTLHFGLRCVQEHTTLSTVNFVGKADDSGREYPEFIKRPNKMSKRGTPFEEKNHRNENVCYWW